MKIITDNLEIDVAILNKIRHEKEKKSEEQFVQLELPLYDYHETYSKKEDEYKSNIIIIEI